MTERSQPSTTRDYTLPQTQTINNRETPNGNNGAPLNSRTTNLAQIQTTTSTPATKSQNLPVTRSQNQSQNQSQSQSQSQSQNQNQNRTYTPDSEQFNKLALQLGSFEQNYRNLLEHQQQLLQQNNNMQQILAILTKAIIVTSIPVNIGGKVEYISLIGKDEFDQIGGEINNKMQLGEEYKNILVNQNKIGITFLSEFTHRLLHPFKPDYDIFLITVQNGTHYSIYGRLINGEIHFD